MSSTNARAISTAINGAALEANDLAAPSFNAESVRIMPPMLAGAEVIKAFSVVLAAPVFRANLKIMPLLEPVPRSKFSTWVDNPVRVTLVIVGFRQPSCVTVSHRYIATLPP